MSRSASPPSRRCVALARLRAFADREAAGPPIGARRRRRSARPASDHAPRPRPGRWCRRRRLPGCWSALAPGRGCRPGTSCAGRGPRRTARRGRAWLRRSRRTSRTTAGCSRRTRARRAATRSRPSARPVAAKARWIDWRRASSRPDHAASRRAAGTAQLMWPPRATRQPPNATSATASAAPAVSARRLGRVRPLSSARIISSIDVNRCSRRAASPRDTVALSQPGTLAGVRA